MPDPLTCSDISAADHSWPIKGDLLQNLAQKTVMRTARAGCGGACAVPRLCPAQAKPRFFLYFWKIEGRSSLHKIKRVCSHVPRESRVHSLKGNSAQSRQLPGFSKHNALVRGIGRAAARNPDAKNPAPSHNTSATIAVELLQIAGAPSGA